MIRRLQRHKGGWYIDERLCSICRGVPASRDNQSCYQLEGPELSQSPILTGIAIFEGEVTSMAVHVSLTTC